MVAAPDRLHGTSGRFWVTRCQTCGAGATSPRVADDELVAFYPEGYGPYDEQMNAPVRLVSRVVRAYQGWAELRSPPLDAIQGRRPGRGLDVGCGRGDLAALLAARGWTMSGVEPSRPACAAAAARGFDVRCGTLRSVTLETSAYDAVIFRHSLEHTTDPATALAITARALVPGGLALITVPNFGGWQARRWRGYWYHLDLPRHRTHFTASAMERALTGAGLETVSISTSSSAVGLPASLQYRLFGRCLFPSGLGLRVASGLCAVALPVALVLDQVGGAGDLLHAVARRP